MVENSAAVLTAQPMPMNSDCSAKPVVVAPRRFDEKLEPGRIPEVRDDAQASALEPRIRRPRGAQRQLFGGRAPERLNGRDRRLRHHRIRLRIARPGKADIRGDDPLPRAPPGGREFDRHAHIRQHFHHAHITNAALEAAADLGEFIQRH